MLDTIGKKLIGNKDERAVSPVIGVILMVAITVILAAVIAAFVLDLGGSVSQEAQAGVSIEVDEDSDQVKVEVKSLGNADYVKIGGDTTSSMASGQFSGQDPENIQMKVGDTATLDASGGGLSGTSGTITAIAVIESDDTETVVASEDYDF